MRVDGLQFHYCRRAWWLQGVGSQHNPVSKSHQEADQTLKRVSQWKHSSVSVCLHTCGHVTIYIRGSRQMFEHTLFTQCSSALSVHGCARARVCVCVCVCVCTYTVLHIHFLLA